MPAWFRASTKTPPSWHRLPQVQPPSLSPFEITCASKLRQPGDRRAGMPHNERIVTTFHGLGIRSTTRLPLVKYLRRRDHFGHSLVPTSGDLVLGRIEHIVEGYRKLERSKTRAQVPSGFAIDSIKIAGIPPQPQADFQENLQVRDN